MYYQTSYHYNSITIHNPCYITDVISLHASFSVDVWSFSASVCVLVFLGTQQTGVRRAAQSNTLDSVASA